MNSGNSYSTCNAFYSSSVPSSQYYSGGYVTMSSSGLYGSYSTHYGGNYSGYKKTFNEEFVDMMKEGIKKAKKQAYYKRLFKDDKDR